MYVLATTTTTAAISGEGLPIFPDTSIRISINHYLFLAPLSAPRCPAVPPSLAVQPMATKPRTETFPGDRRDPWAGTLGRRAAWKVPKCSTRCELPHTATATSPPLAQPVALVSGQAHHDSFGGGHAIPSIATVRRSALGSRSDSTGNECRREKEEVGPRGRAATPAPKISNPSTVVGVGPSSVPPSQSAAPRRDVAVACGGSPRAGSAVIGSYTRVLCPCARLLLP